MEHRYYGKSQPFENWETENLKYLNIENALADLALFIESINTDLQERWGGDRRKVVTIGGSYPGAVSAWARYKYPHIVDAALSSSGVVLAVEDFNQYDMQVYDSLLKSGKECPDTVEAIVSQWDDLYKTDKPKFKESKDALGGFDDATDEEFLMSIAEFIPGEVQYGGRTKVCDYIIGTVAQKEGLAE